MPEKFLLHHSSSEQSNFKNVFGYVAKGQMHVLNVVSPKLFSFLLSYLPDGYRKEVSIWEGCDTSVFSESKRGNPGRGSLCTWK